MTWESLCPTSTAREQVLSTGKSKLTAGSTLIMEKDGSPITLAGTQLLHLRQPSLEICLTSGRWKNSKREALQIPGALQGVHLSMGVVGQVWPLTHFFPVSFLKNFIDLPGGRINHPSSGKHLYLSFLKATPLSPSQTLNSHLVRYFKNSRETRKLPGVQH